MADNDTSKTTTAKSKVEEQAPDADAPGNAEVQSAMDEATERGYFGVEVDETPNEHYTLKGVTAGKPTPETERTIDGK
jgi:hypothetical protein